MCFKLAEEKILSQSLTFHESDEVCVALELGHGSVAVEQAKFTRHGTTPIRVPVNKAKNIRFSCITFWHSKLTKRHHGNMVVVRALQPLEQRLNLAQSLVEVLVIQNNTLEKEIKTLKQTLEEANNLQKEYDDNTVRKEQDNFRLEDTIRKLNIEIENLKKKKACEEKEIQTNDDLEIPEEPIIGQNVPVICQEPVTPANEEEDAAENEDEGEDENAAQEEEVAEGEDVLPTTQEEAENIAFDNFWPTADLNS